MSLGGRDGRAKVRSDAEPRRDLALSSDQSVTDDARPACGYERSWIAASDDSDVTDWRPSHGIPWTACGDKNSTPSQGHGSGRIEMRLPIQATRCDLKYLVTPAWVVTSDIVKVI